MQLLLLRASDISAVPIILFDCDAIAIYLIIIRFSLVCFGIGWGCESRDYAPKSSFGKSRAKLSRSVNNTEKLNKL